MNYEISFKIIISNQVSVSVTYLLVSIHQLNYKFLMNPSWVKIGLSYKVFILKFAFNYHSYNYINSVKTQ